MSTSLLICILLFIISFYYFILKTIYMTHDSTDLTLTSCKILINFWKGTKFNQSTKTDATWSRRLGSNSSQLYKVPPEPFSGLQFPPPPASADCRRCHSRMSHRPTRNSRWLPFCVTSPTIPAATYPSSPACLAGAPRSPALAVTNRLLTLPPPPTL